MNIAKLDKEKLKQEEIERQKKEREELDKIEYLGNLRKEANFQKYVIDGIIKKNINKVTDMRNIPENALDNKDLSWGFMIQSRIARATLEKILGELLN